MTFLDFQSVIHAKSLDVICTTESWLSSEVSDASILSTDYVIYRCDRNTRVGRVLIAISKNIPAKLISPARSVMECLTIELSLIPKLVVCCVYVPPNSADVIY